MTTALVPFEQLNTMAAAFAKSGMFGAKTPEQALSLLLLAQAEGVHPAAAMRDFDIIQGRPAKKAQAMQRDFLAAGGKIEWHRRDDHGADATFSHPQGGTVRVSWDTERAKKAGLSNKDMYGKYGRQMYSARVISEGCRTVYPASTGGMYTPHEAAAMEPKEKDMGSAPVVVDDDIDETLQIPGQSATDTASAPQPLAPPPPSSGAPAVAVFSSDEEASPYISAEMVATLTEKLAACDKIAKAEFLKVAKIESLDKLLREQDGADMYAGALDWLERRRVRLGKTATA